MNCQWHSDAYQIDDGILVGPHVMADDTSVGGVGGVQSSTTAMSIAVAMTADFRQNSTLCLHGWLVSQLSTAHMREIVSSSAYAQIKF